MTQPHTPSAPRISARPACDGVSAVRPTKRKLGPGWVPQAHGAWAMLLLPFLVGVVIRVQSGEMPTYIWPLLPTWLLGYFAYSAVVLWLKSGRKPVYLQPLTVYTGMAAIFGGLTLLAQPALIGWAAVFAPLLGVGLWRATLKDDASLLARGSAVIAACLVCLVVAAGPLSEALTLLPAHRAFLATVVLWVYFIGTLLYVKTMIRERGRTSFYALSVSYHAAVTLLTAWAAWSAGSLSLAIPAFFALATLRAALMPRLEQKTGKRTTPKQVGLLEFALSLILLGVLGWGG